MNILYFGSDVFYPVFSDLAQSSRHTIVRLYTYRAENEYIGCERVEALAKKLRVPARRERVEEEELRALFASGRVDLVFSAEYDRKIPVPKIAGFRGVNIHNSLLPEGRGYFPIETRLYMGLSYGGVTIHKLADNIDAGDILLQERFDISPEENDRDLYQRCAQIARRLTARLLGDFRAHWDAAAPQVGGSYWNMPKECEYTVTQTMTVEQMLHTYRAFGRLTRARVAGRLLKVEHLARADSSPPPSAALAALESIEARALNGIVRIYLQPERRS